MILGDDKREDREIYYRWGIIVLEYLRHKVVKKNICCTHHCVLII